MKNSENNMSPGVRGLARSQFVKRYGVLGWGVSTAVIWAVLMAAIESSASLLVLLPIALVLFPIGGYFFGQALWSVHERS
ncbi:MAG: hypothetical protein ACK526_10855 [Planctomyces sp.]|jgi:hypothetical protein